MSAPLHNNEAERATLGAVIVENASLVEVSSIVGPTDFYSEAHRRIFRCIQALDDHGTGIDFVTLRDALRQRGELDDVGGPVYIAGLADGLPRATNARYYAGIVKEKARLREISAIAQRAIDATAAKDAESAVILDCLEQDVSELSARRPQLEWLSAEALAAQLRSQIETFVQNRGKLRGLETGFQDLDELTHGFHPGEITVLGARPSMGKTALAMQIGLHVAQHASVAVFSLEMTVEALGLRLVAGLAPTDHWRILRGRLSESDQRRVGEALITLGERQVFFDRVAQRTVKQVRARVRALTQRIGPLGLMVIDYLQLLEPAQDDRRETRTVQVANMSRGLKLLARECGTPMLVLSQLNRKAEYTADKQPTLADLRDSGAIEQDADLVWLLHRREVYDKSPEHQGIAELTLAKHRNGETGKLKLKWLAAQQRFADMSPQEA